MPQNKLFSMAVLGAGFLIGVSMFGMVISRVMRPTGGK